MPKFLHLACLIGLGTVAACREPIPARPAPLVVVGVDGADPDAMAMLFERGELPNLERTAAAGSFLPLGTAYGISPVIWTTIATGVRPEEHGIVDFVVETPRGTLPVSSTLRRRPALWNMADRAGRRVAALGWWATWPAEPIDGLLLSDRAGLNVGQEIWPPERETDLARWREIAAAGGAAFGGNPASELHDRLVTLAALDALTARDVALILAYYRSVDLASHDFWHLFEPGSFPAGAPEGAAHAPGASPSPDPVSAAYRALDSAFGELLAAAPEGTSFLLVSDHGFEAELDDSLQLLIDSDRVLEAIGWLVRAGDGSIDLERSRAWTAGSPTHQKLKRLRLGPARRSTAAVNEEVVPLQPARKIVARDLERALAGVRFAGGRPAFRVLVAPPPGNDPNPGADLLLEVLSANATPALTLDGTAIPGAVVHFGRITGGHSPHTRGVLLASGPIFRAGAKLRKPHIHDLAPTILYALGLPVADDFVGRPLVKLFEPDFVARMPVRRIASWGVRATGDAAPSARDRELLDELGALGYLN